jgi:hypothetical protein
MGHFELPFADLVTILGHLVAFGLPLWLVIEYLVAARRRSRIARAVRAERQRVAESQRALARKAVTLRRAS